MGADEEVGFGGMPGSNWGDEPVLRTPRIVGLTIGEIEGREGIGEKDFGIDMLSDERKRLVGSLGIVMIWGGDVSMPGKSE
jgi:hypothetical protein